MIVTLRSTVTSLSKKRTAEEGPGDDVFFRSFATAFPGIEPVHQMAALTPLLRDAPNECAFQGEPDIYGFGIRLGIYLQWTSVLVVKTFKLRGRASLAKSYAISIFAIFVTLLFMTTNAAPSTEVDKSSKDAPKGPYAVEVIILAYIIFGGVYIVLLTGNDPMQQSKASM
ncbi:hypothetical protein FSOLCH5_015030 [Fusarium solani]